MKHFIIAQFLNIYKYLIFNYSMKTKWYITIAVLIILVSLYLTGSNIISPLGSWIGIGIACVIGLVGIFINKKKKK